MNRFRQTMNVTTTEVVRALRAEGFTAYAESDNGAEILVTDARLSLVLLAAGHGQAFVREYPAWTATRAGEDFDRAQTLAYDLTSEDRANGLAAPMHGYSRERFAEAQKLVRAGANRGAAAERMETTRRLVSDVSYPWPSGE
jgi:hypothetical protein